MPRNWDANKIAIENELRRHRVGDGVMPNEKQVRMTCSCKAEFVADEYEQAYEAWIQHFLKELGGPGVS